MGKDSSGKSGSTNGMPTLVGDFKIIREIGSGGMAKVYEAEQISLNRRVALKILPAHLSYSPDSIRKFKREAEAGGRQSHPGIVSIYAIGEDEGIHYIAEELVENGTTLADQLDTLRNQDKLPIGYFREAAAFIAEVAEALKHAHDTHVIHRDVKPSNILLTPEGEPKVTDFGLARFEDALALSRTGDFAGTPYYMSPEQAMSRRIGIDHRTDIYSLGVTLYETLTLERPFKGDTSHEVLKQIILKEPCEPHRVNPRVPRDLSVICLKAMDKDPGRRYQDMTAFAADLNRFLHGEVILARPSSLANRAWKRLRRNPMVSGALGCAILALLILVINIMWSYPRIKAERNKAVAINGFLENLLESVNPGMDGREVKVMDIIDQAALNLESSFSGEPEVRAALQNTLGHTYYSLGLYEGAEAMHRAALSTFLDCLGAEHHDTIMVKNNLAMDLSGQGGHDKAEILLQEVVALWKSTQGEEDPETLTAMDNLAGIMGKQGRLEDAAALHEIVLAARKLVLPEEHPHTVRTMHNLAGIYLIQTRYDLAEPLCIETVEIRKRTLGMDDPHTLQSMSNLACLHKRLQNYDTAKTIYNEVIEKQIQVLPENHPETLTTMNNLAELLMQTEKIQAGLKLYQQVLEGYKKAYSDAGPETLAVMCRIADWYTRTKYFPEAESMYRQVVEARLEFLGTKNPATVMAVNRLAHVLSLRNNPADGVKLIMRVISDVQEALPPEHPERIMLHANMGKFLIAQKDYDQAEAQVVAYYKGSCLNNDPHQIKDALETLVKLYVRWDKPEKEDFYRPLLVSSIQGQ